MKNYILIILFFATLRVSAQVVSSIKVGGDFDKFYPTVWSDGGWNNNAVSELEICRSAVHGDSDWRGALMAKFHFHTTVWGNGAHFINAEIVQHHNIFSSQNFDFIAGWRDATVNNGSGNIIIWLRGGGTTYHYKSEHPTSCTVYDGVVNPLLTRKLMARLIHTKL